MKKMRAGLFVLAMMTASVPALGADETVPVREIIEATARNWEEGSSGQEEDEFSEDRLNRLFSAEFAAAFRAASKYPPMDPPEGETTGSPFDYDPIAQGQDGCPFKNIRIENDGDGQVTATFNNRNCYPETADAPDTVLIFHVVTEKGLPVIDDFYPVVDGNSGSSIKQELKLQGAE